MTDVTQAPRDGVRIDAITSIHYFEFDDSFRDEPEAHEPWELVFCDRGECGLLADGRHLCLHQGELYFHKPNEVHMLELVKGIAPNIFIITFTSRSPAMRYFEGRRLVASMAVKQHISAILHEATETFELTFNNPRMQPLRLCREPLFGGEQTVRLRLELMLIEILRSDDRYAPPPKAFFPKEIVTDPFALRIIAFMEERLYSRFTMEEMGRALSFGKAYLSRYFSRVCGDTIIDYFGMMKVNEAKRLIRETDKNFGEISELLAFSNPHYFSAIFKKHTGMTPTQYKRSCRIV